MDLFHEFPSQDLAIFYLMALLHMVGAVHVDFLIVVSILPRASFFLRLYMHARVHFPQRGATIASLPTLTFLCPSFVLMCFDASAPSKATYNPLHQFTSGQSRPGGCPWYRLSRHPDPWSPTKSSGSFARFLPWRGSGVKCHPGVPPGWFSHLGH